MRVAVQRDPWIDNHLIQELGRKVQAILKVHQKRRAVMVGSEVETLLASYPPLVKYLWKRM